MAGDLDGTQFVSLDTDIVGGRSSPGATDAETRMLSTYVENRLDANARYLISRGQEVTYNFYADAVEARRHFASLRSRHLLRVPWRVDPTIDELRMKYWGGMGLSATPDAQIHMTLYLELPRTDKSVETRSTFTAASGLNVRTLSLDVSAIAPDSPQFGFVGVRFQQAARASTAQNDNVDRNLESFQFMDDSSGDTPVGSANADRYWSSFHGQSVTIYNKESGTSPTIAHGDTDIDIANSTALREQSFLTPLAINLRSSHRTSGWTGGPYIDKSAKSMEAQAQVQGQDVSEHGANLDNVWRRPRILAVGPPGENQGDDWPSGYRRKWQWASLGQQTTPDAALDRQSGWIAEPGQRFAVDALVAVFRETSTSAGIPGAYYSEPREEGKLQEVLSFGDAVFGAVAVQMDNGDTGWSNATALGSGTGRQNDFPVIPNAKAAWSDLLMTWYTARHPRGRGSVPSTGNDYRYNFREGMLGSGDIPLVQPVRVEFSISGATPGNPIRLNFTFDNWANFPEDPPDDKTTDAYHCVCFQTVWTSITDP